jgi:hypothetical protein
MLYCYVERSFLLEKKMEIEVGQLLKQEVFIIAGDEINETFRPAIVIQIDDVESRLGLKEKFYRLYISGKLLWYAESELKREKISII